MSNKFSEQYSRLLELTGNPWKGVKEERLSAKALKRNSILRGSACWERLKKRKVTI
jgi:hypothetical protein